MSGIINEDRLRELIDGRVKAMKPEVKSQLGLIYLVVVMFSIVLSGTIYHVRMRLNRLESIVATDREFSHGVQSLGPAISIQPRPHPEPLPEPRETP